jgi:hypothetical protein
VSLILSCLSKFAVCLSKYSKCIIEYTKSIKYSSFLYSLNIIFLSRKEVTNLRRDRKKEQQDLHSDCWPRLPLAFTGPITMRFLSYLNFNTFTYLTLCFIFLALKSVHRTQLDQKDFYQFMKKKDSFILLFIIVIKFVKKFSLPSSQSTSNLALMTTKINDICNEELIPLRVTLFCIFAASNSCINACIQYTLESNCRRTFYIIRKT